MTARWFRAEFWNSVQSDLKLMGVAAAPLPYPLGWWCHGLEQWRDYYRLWPKVIHFFVLHRIYKIYILNIYLKVICFTEEFWIMASWIVPTQFINYQIKFAVILSLLCLRKEKIHRWLSLSVWLIVSLSTRLHMELSATKPSFFFFLFPGITQSFGFYFSD